jgi:hypothetical protein
VDFYFPDSQDQIDPSFDFVSEQGSPLRIRQRDDLYPHELLGSPPYDGMLISKAMVDGVEGGAGRYSAQQRQRLFRVGIREFFRLTGKHAHIRTLGDCGAFSYVRHDEPPYTVDDVIDFYEASGVDAGISLDHVILGFSLQPSLDDDTLRSEWVRRRELTLELADAFLQRRTARGCSFEPVGVAQGWSPETYAASVASLQEMGYERICLGGLVAQKTHEILAVLQAIEVVRWPRTRLHLLGVTRCESIPRFAELGVASFDSTSPFRQAFKDDKDNYHGIERNWVALRVPQVDANRRLRRRIASGEVDFTVARELEQRTLATLNRFDRDEAGVDETLEVLSAYALLSDEKPERFDAYRETLQDRPWKDCDCGVCREAGIHAIVFRGSERNKRRGFHNLHVFAQRFATVLQDSSPAGTVAAVAA